MISEVKLVPVGGIQTMRATMIIPFTLLLMGCEGSKPNDTEPSVVVHRYVITASATEPRTTILLDTATGKTWFQVHEGQTGDEVNEWLPMEKTTFEDWMKFRERLQQPLQPLPAK